MSDSAHGLSSALADIVGAAHMSDSPGTTALCAVDGIEPRWVVRPGNAEEVSRILALAWAEGLAVAPRGSGARTALGNPPNRLDLALDLTRLSAIVDYVPEDMVATVQCGITLGALAQRLAQHGQRLALDPLDGDGRTVGGVLATGSSGPLRFRYGTGRDLLLGVRFVQADGTVTWGGAKVVKSVSGYDVPKLMVGALGTLGVIVEATLRLHPEPAASETMLVSAKSPAGLQDLLAALLDSSLEPDRIWLLNTEALRGFSAMFGALPAGPALLVTFGSVEEAVRSQGEALVGLARNHGGTARRVQIISRDNLGKYLGGPGQLSFTLGCEIRRVGHWLAELERLAATLEEPVSVVGEAGNGVLHGTLWGDVAARPFLRDLVIPLRRGLEAEGGSLVVEAMPMTLKVGFDVWGAVAPGALAIMRRIKQEFDPRGVLNPGRFVGGL